MGIDGISLWLVVLTTFLTPLCVLISWHSVHDRVKEFFILLLIMETALIGVFTSLDLFLFYFFWEATLIPMALLIGVFGHERKVYAAVKFFMYTMIASVFMLAAILWLYAHTGTFDFVVIRDQIARGAVPAFPAAAQWLFLGFFLAFAVKVPLFPFHTWLPDAHVEAPTAGSVLLAGVLLKMGTYGMLRFNLGLFPDAGPPQRALDHGSRADRHYLRRAGGDGAAEYEEADRLLLGQPFGICGARNFQLYPGRAERRDVCNAGARSLYRRTVHAGGDSARTATHVRNCGVWRARIGHAGLCGFVSLHRARIGWTSADERIRRRISGAERCVPGEGCVRNPRRDGRDLERRATCSGCIRECFMAR